MKINFSLDVKNDDKLLFYGNKNRWSSLTGIVFISNNLLVTNSFYNRKLYLIEFDIDKNSYNIISNIDTINSKKQTVVTDLVHYNGNHIVTSNLLDCSVSLYKIYEKKLIYLKTIENKHLGLCHGVHFYPLQSNILFFATSGTSNPNCGIYGINLKNKNPFISITENNLLAKDLCFTPDGKLMFGIYSESAPSATEKRFYSSKVVMYNVNSLTSISKKNDLYLPNCHIDCIKHFDNKIYITSQELEDGGYIYEISYNDEMMEIINKKGPYQFPHGLDISFNLIAITEYGTNCLTIEKF